MIMRQGSNLQELIFRYPLLYWYSKFYFFPTISIFTTYMAGIANLKSLNIEIDMNNQKVIEFLSLVSESCNGIVNFELLITQPKMATIGQTEIVDDFSTLNNVCAKQF